MPAQYRHNKFKTLSDIVRQIDNWPTALGMRIFRDRPGLRLLAFRDGRNVVCRSGSRDWDVVHELLFAGGYARAFEFLRETKGPATVLDLGGNIGLFSLLAAAQRPDITVHAFEPGPPNYRLFEMNRLANPQVTDRIHLNREAVGGESATVNWFFDEANPGGSSLYGTSGKPFPVTIRAFSEVMAAMSHPIALAKIDIEGAEFDLLRGTSPAVWQRVAAVALELHDDPSRQMTQAQFLDYFKAQGYSIEDESVCSYFLHR